MIKKILVTQDGSDYSKAALEYGVWLAKRFEASLIGYHVVDIVALEGPFLHDLSGSLGFEPFLNFSTKMREALEAKGSAFLSSFEDFCKTQGVACETMLSFGIVPNEIVEKGKLADLLILGQRGVNARYEFGMLGSTTEGVIRKSPKPVLITPKDFREIKKPMLAYDGSPTSSRAMHSAAEWMKILKLPLTVLNVSKESAFKLGEAENYLKPYAIEAKFAGLEAEDPPVAIENYYNENRHDLLFMGASHHSRIVEMVLGSTTEHVMRAINGPFFLER